MNNSKSGKPSENSPGPRRTNRRGSRSGLGRGASRKYGRPLYRSDYESVSTLMYELSHQGRIELTSRLIGMPGETSVRTALASAIESGSLECHGWKFF